MPSIRAIASVLGVFGSAALLGGCALLPARPGPLVARPDADRPGTARQIATRARAAEVVYLGETHDNSHHHALQHAVLEALVAGGARPLLAFEMLPEALQARLDEVLAGGEGVAGGDRRLGWTDRGWPDLAMYWPLFETARRHRLGGLATDLEPALVRRVAREGLAALGPAGAPLASRLPADPAREAAIARTMQAAHCGRVPAERLPRMVESWHARNVAMGRRIAQALDGGPAPARLLPRVVVIVGRGHQDAGGLPDQLAALRPGTRQLVVSFVEVLPGEHPDDVARATPGDVVWLTEPVGPGRRVDPCAALRLAAARRP